MTSWTCVIPGKPRQKGNTKRIVKFGNRMALIGDKVTLAAEQNAKGIAFTQRPAELLAGPLIVDVDFCFAIPATRRKGKHAVKPGDPYEQGPDRGNLLKLVEDVLEGIAYANDRSIFDGRVRKIWAEVDETRVTVRCVEAQ